MARIYRQFQRIDKIYPADGKYFTYEELCQAIGCKSLLFYLIRLNQNILIASEDAFNEKDSSKLNLAGTKALRQNNGVGTVYGTCVMAGKEELKNIEQCKHLLSVPGL